MAQLYNVQTGTLVGEISEEQLHFLQEQLEEESAEDQDYYLSADTIDLLAGAGADEALIEMLRGSLDENGEVEIRWSET